MPARGTAQLGLMLQDEQTALPEPILSCLLLQCFFLPGCGFSLCPGHVPA